MSLIENESARKTMVEMSRAGYAGVPQLKFEGEPVLAALRKLGTELWLDTGDLQKARPLWRREFSALTTNNTLVNQVVQTGAMDEVIQKAVGAFESLPSEDDRVMAVAFVVNCKVALGLVEALAAKVSVELHPGIARDVDATVEYGKLYYSVCPEQFFVKVPLTPEGYCAARRLRKEGVPVNFTVGFSARQNYLAAAFSGPKYCNVFLGRLNSVVADNGLGDGKYVGEKATLATQKEILRLRAEERSKTRLIAASLRSAQQMADLAGVDVHTAPPQVAEGFLALRPSDIRFQVQTNYEVKLKEGLDERSTGLDILWTVDHKFRKFVDDLEKGSPDSLTGEDMVKASEDHGVGLFRRFTKEEIAEIAERGKIPDLARWQGKAALDDLMTHCALQSFATDQKSLDDRIRSFVK
jgi:transaldolase